MQLHREMFEEFFKNRLPEEGFTLDDVYDGYFGLIHATHAIGPELHGFVVTMDGDVLLPQFGTVTGLKVDEKLASQN
jgi:hypothetical protein